MKKSAIVIFFAAFLSVTGSAQNVQEGVNHIYAERYQSAKSVFDKLIAANPNNIEAIYWLGQDNIAMGNTAGARAVYEKALTANGNAPLILAGMGNVELLEGNPSAARQHFESAITASHGKKGNDPLVLNAIARANVDAYSESKKTGDLDYAIAKLNEAIQANPNNAESYLILGNAYRRKHDGSSAVQDYRKARQINPGLAVADYRIAMLFKTQTTFGQGNWDIVLENLNNAIAADPKFAPAYLELYYYYLLYKKDFATADNYASKYISNSDPSVENDYIKAQTDFVEKKFTEAITIAKNILAQTNNNAKSRVYRLLGYSYLGAKDTTAACDAVNQFFVKAKEEEVIGQDYLLRAEACGRNNPEAIRADVTKAVQMDSVPSRQLAMLNEEINKAKENNQRVLEAELRLISYQLRGANASPTELISYITVPFYLGGAYQKADSVAKVYSTIAPDSIYGYYWSALALSRIDTTMEQGLAVPAFEKSLQIAETDKVRYKSQGLQAASTLAAYYNNIKKDKESAIKYLQKGLAFDPGNANLQNFLKILQTPVKQAPQKAPAKKPGNSGTKPKKSGA
ncbi:MAG TPA: tetratricopeptide repeat protein [Flavisolibacter sp.]|nr:tetratricopeptide repeat protein [Flavisolibacter sp.]